MFSATNNENIDVASRHTTLLRRHSEVDLRYFEHRAGEQNVP